MATTQRGVVNLEAPIKCMLNRGMNLFGAFSFFDVYHSVFIEFVTIPLLLLCFGFFGWYVGIRNFNQVWNLALSCWEGKMPTVDCQGNPVWAFPSPPSVPRAAFPSSTPHASSFGGQDANHLSNSRLQSIFANWKRIQIVSTLKKKSLSWPCSDSGTTCRSSAKSNSSRKWELGDDWRGLAEGAEDVFCLADLELEFQ